MSSTYQTIQGDMWDLISKNVYRTEVYMNVLMDANPDYVGVSIFDDGVTLVVPDISTATPVFGLPPWRRVAQVT